MKIAMLNKIKEQCVQVQETLFKKANTNPKLIDDCFVNRDLKNKQLYNIKNKHNKTISITQV